MTRGLNKNNIKRVIYSLKESPKTFNELKKTGVPERSLARILKEYLPDWGLVYKDENNYYNWYENVRTYENENDYKLALNHSKRLVLSSLGNKRYDKTDPFLMLDTLAFLDKDPLLNNDDVNFLRHLETGYIDAYKFLMEYRKLLDEMGFRDLEEYGLPLFGKFNHDFESPDELIQVAASIRVGYSMMSNYYSDYDQNKIKRLLFLRDLLVGRIYSIVNGVKHNIPLRGHCSYCPNIKIR